MPLQPPDQLTDDGSFHRLFRQYYVAIRNYLYFKCGDMDLAEDLAQETFLIVWEKRASVDPARVKSYLYTIAGNLFLNELKHRKVVFKYEQQPTVSHTAEHPEFLMEAAEFQAEVERTIESLPEKNREVFLMNRIEKMTYQEIAERLEISVKAVEKRMHKALQVFKKFGRKV